MISRIRLQIHVMNNDRYGEEEHQPPGIIRGLLPLRSDPRR